MQILDEARKRCTKFCSLIFYEIIFTSSSTEGNNIAILAATGKVNNIEPNRVLMAIGLASAETPKRAT
jgi:cysteine sulfinate desulfinase/cysteine desulfurase-like protein